MRLILFSVLFVLMHSKIVFADQQILIDKLASEYIASEKALWKKIDTQLILLDRGSLLNEVYHEHARILKNDFGENRVLWSLGIQKYEQLINTVLSIDTNVRNIRDYLMNSEYVKLADLAKNAAAQMQRSADDLHAAVGRASFWSDLALSVSYLIEKCFYCHFHMFP